MKRGATAFSTSVFRGGGIPGLLMYVDMGEGGVKIWAKTVDVLNGRLLIECPLNLHSSEKKIKTH